MRTYGTFGLIQRSLDGPTRHTHPLIDGQRTAVPKKIFHFHRWIPSPQNVRTSAYHRHTNDQAEWYKRTILTRLRNYVADHQRSWHLFIKPSKYANNTQVHRSVNKFPYSLVLSRQPPGPSLLSATTIAPKAKINETSPRAMLDLFRQQILTLSAKKSSAMRKFQVRYEADYDNRVCESSTYVSRSYVFVDNLTVRAD